MPGASPDQLAEAFTTALNAQDLDAALDLWADEALFLPVVGTPVVGREAIRELLGALTSSETKLHIETATTYMAGDTAVRVGRMKLVAAGGADGPTELPSNYVTVYRRDADGWKIVIDAPAGFPVT